jgi:hypothetical protein
MPGYPPPPDEPSVEDQVGVDASASFEPAPGAISICSFQIPTFKFNLRFKLPSFSIPFPPTFNFSFKFKCDLGDPFDVSAGVEWGGGRKASGPRDPDDVDTEKYMRA